MRETHTLRLEDVMLLAGKQREGPETNEWQQPLGKTRKKDSLLEPPEGTKPASTLVLAK